MTTAATARRASSRPPRLFDGVVLGDCRAKRDTVGFLRFLDHLTAATAVDQAIHLTLDNLSAHKSPPAQA